MSGKSRILPDKNRLRWILIAFFLALAIPTALLVAKSLDQLKWQTVYQYRGLASELVSSIDSSLIDRARREATRRFDEYGFLQATNNPAFQQRSALAAFPVTSEIPGTIGYFQIDGAGRFSSPLIPTSSAADLGITPAEMTQRQALGARVKRILTDNELISPVDSRFVQRDDSVADLAADSVVAEQTQRNEEQKPQKQETQAQPKILGRLKKRSNGRTQSESNFDRLSATSASRSLAQKKNIQRCAALKSWLWINRSMSGRGAARPKNQFVRQRRQRKHKPRRPVLQRRLWQRAKIKSLRSSAKPIRLH